MSTCLTITVTLGAFTDDVCIVGGLVPALLIDAGRTTHDDDERHTGTNDLDLALALALLDDERYAEISQRLRAEGFTPDTNASGNETVQRWRLGEHKVTVDLLLPPAPGQAAGLRVQKLEPDFGAIVTPGLELAFDERALIELEGRTLKGERVRRQIPVCGPAAFVMLKALAFGDRAEPKDAYDLVYVIRYTPGRRQAIADRLRQHAVGHPKVVARGLELLARDFGDPDGLGPGRDADFILVEPEQRDGHAADAHGFVDDLLRAHRVSES